MITNQEINILSLDNYSASVLVDAAKTAGGADNISVVRIRIAAVNNENTDQEKIQEIGFNE